MQGYSFFFFRKNYDKVMLVILAIATLIFALHNISNITQLYFLADEFTYGSIAAYLAGYNWSDVTSLGSYYSSGYSILLVPLFILFKSSYVIHKAAIVFNALLLTGSFILSYNCGRKIYSDINKIYLMITCFIIVIYPNCLVQSNIAWSEILLYFLFWCCFRVIIELHYQPTSKLCILLAFFLAYMYLVHQRCLGVVAAVTIIIVGMRITKKINNKQIISFIIILTLGLFFQYFIKNFFQGELWSHSELIQINDYSSQANKIAYLFKIEGLKNLIKSICGKLFYIGIGTYTVGFVGLFYLFYDILKNLKNILYKRFDNLFWINSFILLSFIGALAICSLYYIMPDRIDQVIYGRYIEYIFGPLLLVSLLNISKRPNLKYFLFSALILAVLSYVVKRNLSYVTGYIGLQSSAITMFMKKNYTALDVYRAYFASISIGILFFLLISYTKRFKYIATTGALLLLSVCWFYNTELLLKNIVNYAQEKYSELWKFTEYINKYDIDEDVVFVYSNGVDEFRNQLSMIIQYDLKDKQLDVINENEIDNVITDTVFIKNNSDEFDEHKYTKLAEAFGFIMFTQKNNSIQQKIEKDLYNNQTKLSFKDGTTQNNISKNIDYYVSNGDKGVLYSSPDMNLIAGTYKVNMTIGLLEFKNKVGYIQVISNDGKCLNKIELNKEDFDKNSIANYSLAFSDSSDMKNIKIEVYAYKNSKIKILPISYCQTSFDYTIGLDNTNEMKNIVKKINQIDEYDKNYNNVYILNETTVKGDESNSLLYLKELLPQNNVEFINYDKIKSNSPTGYLLLFADSKVVYSLLDKYTVITKNSNYILLAPTNSNIISNVAEKKIELLSDGNKLIPKYFASGNYNNQKSLNLPRGTYNLAIEVSCLDNKILNEKLGELEVSENGTIIRKIDIKNSDFISTNKKIIMVNLSSPKKIKNIKIKFSTINSNITGEIKYIEAISNGYEIGYDDQQGITNFRNLVNQISSNNIVYYIKDDNYTNIPYSDNYLKLMFNNNNIEVIDTNNIESDNINDNYILLDKNNEILYELLDNYTIIGDSRNYVILIPSNGNLMNNAINKNVNFISKGKKINNEFYLKNEDDLKINNSYEILTAGDYNISLNISLDNYLNDNVGYIKIVDDNGTLYKLTLNANDFENSNYYVEVPITSCTDIKNLKVLTYCNEGSKINTEVQYIEKIYDCKEIDLSDITIKDKKYNYFYGNGSDSNIITISNTSLDKNEEIIVFDLNIENDYNVNDMSAKIQVSENDTIMFETEGSITEDGSGEKLAIFNLPRHETMNNLNITFITYPGVPVSLNSAYVKTK